MNEILVKYRTWYKGEHPKPIKLQIPGWAGENRDHDNGSKPQPWHCPPFVDGSTYGHELVYPFKNECTVRMVKGEIVFEGDFSSEDWNLNEDTNPEENGSKKKSPPMLSFAPSHYGMSSSLDMEPPEGFVIRTEPHPRFYTDTTGTVPCMLAGHIQRWWSRIFFVVFKAPREGEFHVFRPGEPYGQVLFVPQKNNVKFTHFTPEEEAQRENRERRIGEHGNKIATHVWRDHKHLTFDNKYKILSSAYSKGGYECIDQTIINKANSKKTSLKTKLPKKLIQVKK